MLKTEAPSSRRSNGDGTAPSAAYRTSLGVMYQTTVERFLRSRVARAYSGKCQLIITSPPFPLNRKKAYGNFTGQEYKDWLEALAPKFVDLLSDDGSVVIELGNAWVRGLPVMSTLSLEALLAFLKAGDLHLCQQFVAHNPARLPGPIQWVNKKRIRVKDSFTHVWWMARTPNPKADNRRVLQAYGSSMRQLHASG